MAGVFTELVTASLRPATGNPAPESAPPSAPALCIDTITGASAGAMTGLIAARSLLVDPDRALRELAGDDPGEAGSGDASGRREPSNGFYRAWVRPWSSAAWPC
jgi:predicted acylesterase/phospholipase RssA